jgi:hypothetical protein
MTKFVSKQEMPKKKLNHFLVYNKKTNTYDEVKYLTQNELAEGWRQVYPTLNNKKLINHFNIILAYLPEHLWSKKNKNNIKDKNTRYTISETNQDNVMVNLYNEITSYRPNKEILQNLIDELDETIHNSWIVIRSKNYISNGKIYESEPVNTFVDYKITDLI